MLSTVLGYTREKYILEDYLLIQYQILGTKITRIVGQIVRRVFDEIRRQKPKLKIKLGLKRIKPVNKLISVVKFHVYFRQLEIKLRN